jgi:hypothetical protein
MPATSKRSRMLEEVADYHVQRKQARTLHMVAQFLDDLPSSDALANTDMSESLSLVSSPSFASSSSPDISDPSSSPSRHSNNTHLGHTSSSSGDFDNLEDTFLEWWDARVQALVTSLLTVWVLDTCPPVQKLGQLCLILTDFRCDHPDRF